jgi:hypothetical protein
MALHDKLQAAGSRVKSLCAAPGLAATNLQVRPTRSVVAADRSGRLSLRSAPM